MLLKVMFGAYSETKCLVEKKNQRKKTESKQQKNWD